MTTVAHVVGLVLMAGFMGVVVAAALVYAATSRRDR